ncbi:MAG: TonB-dependent receptor [Prolixibacteraceae bacterium]|nr:TonB-dependent receptor [Prolixibacteraceae bacterium]
MKLAIFLLLLSVVSVFASKTYSQTKGLTLNMENKTVKEVLQNIEAQSQFYFMYSEKLVDVNREVSVNMKNQKINEVLDALFAGTNVNYKIKDCFILLTTHEVVGNDLKVAQQSKSVSGRITDSSGAPLPGVTVVVKGTTKGTITGNEGNYTLSDVPADATLVFSFVGMKTQEIPLEGKTIVDIIMSEEAVGIEEVVAVGYGTQKKVNLTGSVSAVDAEALEAIPVQNAVQALQGQIPGLYITQTSGGALDARASLNIRGLTTIGQGSGGSPLVLIDGMEGDLFTINPQDIESVSVLKDAASSSIYGSRAPFGVILVTTKKGKAGRTVINYNNSFRFGNAINMPQEMDSYTWATYFNDASRNAGWGDWVGPERMQRIKDYMAGKISYTTIPIPGSPNNWGTGYDYANDNIDYYDVFFKDVTKSQEHNLSASGGNEEISYFVSGNYLHEGGMMNYGGDGLNRYNTFGKVNAKVSKIAGINYSMRYTRSDHHRPSHMDDYWFFQEIGRQSWPVSPLYDPNGNLFNDHVLGMERGGQIKKQETAVIQQLGVTLEPLKGWRIVGNLNYRYNSNFTHTDYQTYWQTAVDGVSRSNTWFYDTVSEYGQKNDYINVDAYSEYEKKIAEHNFKILLGFQAENYNTRDLWGQKQGIMVPGIPTLNTTSGISETTGKAVPPLLTGGYGSWATAGFFGRLNYNYQEKYLLEANLRYDASSRFRQNQRWGLFPSVSAGWNLARESFFEPLSSVINTLKPKVSYGSLGNQNTDAWYPTYEIMGYSIAGDTWLINGVKPNGSWPAALISKALTWEEIQSWNAGLDFGLLNNRLTGSFEYFIRKTLNMVGPADELPALLGTAVPVTNNTDLKTKGFDLELMWHDRVADQLNYSIRFVLSDSQGEITRYSNPSGTLSQYYTGMKWGDIWGYETKGIARTQEEMDTHLASLTNGGQSKLGQDWRAGDIMYADVDKDGQIDWGSSTINDHGDLKVIGNSTPRFNYGLDLTADWKGFDFRLFLQGVGKRDYYQGSWYFWGAHWYGVWWSMGLKQHEDYFRNDPNHPLGLNPDGYYPRPLWGTAKNQQTQTRYLQNAAYMRIKNLQFGYTLPANATQKIGINKLRLFVSGENLATFTKMTTIFDPETIGGNNLGNVYPLSKVYSFGLNATF